MRAVVSRTRASVVIDALRSEWIKLSTVRTSWVLFIVAVTFPIVIAVITAIVDEERPDRR